jgi:hypothetical protein
MIDNTAANKPFATIVADFWYQRLSIMINKVFNEDPFDCLARSIQMVA